MRWLLENLRQDQTYFAARPEICRPTDPALYVGSDTCKTCHEDIYKNFKILRTLPPPWNQNWIRKGSGLARLRGLSRTWKRAHGRRRRQIQNFHIQGASPRPPARVAPGCHQYNEEHSNYDRSAHLANGIGCIDCHSPHNAKESQFLMSEKSPELCYKCHMDVRAQFAQPFHHRVNEGLIQCNDCHNPHGSFLPKQLRTNASGDECLQMPLKHVPVCLPA